MKISAPDGLRALADWLDAYDARRGSTADEVQRDLRRWSTEWAEREARSRALEEGLRAVDKAFWFKVTTSSEAEAALTSLRALLTSEQDVKHTHTDYQEDCSLCASLITEGRAVADRVFGEGGTPDV